MSIANLEASVFKYLYDELEVGKSIRIFDDVNLESFKTLTEWVVFETLTNPLGDQPKQLFFLHASLQKGLKRERILLARLVDKVLDKVAKGTRLPLYDFDAYETELAAAQVGDPPVTPRQIGEMEVTENSLSPVMHHISGGVFRSITIGVVYAAI